MRSFILWALFICLQFNQSFAQRQKIIAIVGATLIDGTGNTPLVHAVVLIKGTRIAEVGTTETVTIPPGALRIDATGKFL